MENLNQAIYSAAWYGYANGSTFTYAGNTDTIGIDAFSTYQAALAAVGAVTFTVRNTGKSAYRYLERAGRRFRGWLTVTATAVILNAVRVFHRIFSKTAACCFNRRTWVRQGRLRL